MKKSYGYTKMRLEMKKPYTHYYENIVVSKSSGVKKKLKERASEMRMSLTEVIEYLLDVELNNRATVFVKNYDGT